MSYTPINSAVLTATMNNLGTIATSNSQGTLATSANQVTGNAVAQAIMNAQGSQSTAGLATSTFQATGNTIAQVVMNNEGTLATQATLAQVMNNQGTIASRLFWGTGTYQGTPSVLQEVGVNNGRMRVETAFADTPALDAFSRLRVSTPAYRFDGQFTYQVNTDLWDQSSSGGSITHDSTNRLAALSNNAGTNVTALQSHYHAPYTPGRGQFVLVTFNLKAAPSSGQTKRVGYFDDNNGVFLEWDATNGISVNIRSGTANGNQRVAQANWNIDTMLNGTGPSGVTLDLTKIQIFFVTMQALYTGRVIVGFDIDGRLWPVHEFLHANRVTAPYIQIASQTIRYELRGTNSAASAMDAICASVMSEGGEELLDIPGRAFSVNSSSGTAVTSTLNPIICIRPKALFNNLRNYALVVPTQLTVCSRTNPSLVQIFRNGTVIGPGNTPYVDVDTQNSVCEYNQNGTAITGGQLIYSAMCDGAGFFPLDASSLGRAVATYSYALPVNQADSFAITATSLNATAQVTVNLNWKEIR